MSLICFPLERASILTSLLVPSVCLSTGSEARSDNECQGIALGTEAVLILSVSHSQLLLHYMLVRAWLGACSVDSSAQV